MDNIDVEYAREKNIYVFKSLASLRSVAELVFAHFFSLARNPARVKQINAAGGRKQKFNELKKSFAKAFELKEKLFG